MPGDNIHKLAGLGGALYAGYRAKSETGPNCLIEVAGGAAGWRLGGQLSDILEPALSSWHRNTAHSCLAAGVIITDRFVKEMLTRVARPS